MHKEIEDVVGHGRLPNMSDKPILPYSEAVVHETLRLGNIAKIASFINKTFRKKTCDYQETVPRSTTPNRG
jgi:hypothetical protein